MSTDDKNGTNGAPPSGAAEERNIICNMQVTEARNPCLMTRIPTVSATQTPDTLERGRKPGDMTPVRPSSPQPAQNTQTPLKK